MADLPPNITCTPDALINAYHCTKCLSKRQLMALLATVLYAIDNAGSTNVTNELQDGKCFCISEKQFLEGIVNAYVEWAIAKGLFADFQAALDASKCLDCAPPQNVRGIVLANLCEFLNDNWPVLL